MKHKRRLVSNIGVAQSRLVHTWWININYVVCWCEMTYPTAQADMVVRAALLRTSFTLPRFSKGLGLSWVWKRRMEKHIDILMNQTKATKKLPDQKIWHAPLMVSAVDGTVVKRRPRDHLQTLKTLI